MVFFANILFIWNDWWFFKRTAEEKFQRWVENEKNEWNPGTWVFDSKEFEKHFEQSSIKAVFEPVIRLSGSA